MQIINNTGVVGTAIFTGANSSLTATYNRIGKAIATEAAVKGDMNLRTAWKNGVLNQDNLFVGQPDPNFDFDADYPGIKSGTIQPITNFPNLILSLDAS